MADLLPDQMTSKERHKAFFEGRDYDRIPCNCLVGDHAAKLMGIGIGELHLSARNMAGAQVLAHQTYRTEAAGVGPGLAGIAEALGSRVEFPRDNAPYISRFAAGDAGQVGTLAIPSPRRDGRLPLFLEALQILLEELGDELPISSGLPGPFTTAANIRGTENFLRDIHYHPELAHRTLRLALDSTVAYVEEAGKLGVNFNIADPTASGSLISPRHFREFALPYLQELVQAILQTGAERPSLHICGRTVKIWGYMADTGAGILSLDNTVDLAAAKQAVGDRIALSGNVKPMETMLLGTPHDVEENAKDCLRKAYDNPKGYILGLGCGLPPNSPPENIHTFFESARKYGRYPLDPVNFA